MNNCIMNKFYCFNHTHIKTIRDCFLHSFLTSGTIFWSLIIDSELTRVTRGPLSAPIWSFCFSITRIQKHRSRRKKSPTLTRCCTDIPALTVLCITSQLFDSTYRYIIVFILPYIVRLYFEDSLILPPCFVVL